MTEALQALAGFTVLHLLAWLLSENRRAVTWRPVLAGAAATLLLAAVFLRLPAFAEVFLVLNRVVEAIDRATAAGAAFVFGFLAGGEAPYQERPGASSFILAFRALPIVLVVSALSALLFHWRVLPAVVRAFAAVLRRTLGLGGAVGVAAAANVFVGMVEAPLFVRPYLARMTRSELFVTMTCGMATVAGTVMVLYATVLAKTIPGARSYPHCVDRRDACRGRRLAADGSRRRFAHGRRNRSAPGRVEQHGRGHARYA